MGKTVTSSFETDKAALSYVCGDASPFGKVWPRSQRVVPNVVPKHFQRISQLHLIQSTVHSL
jgi:hypothetical protein